MSSAAKNKFIDPVSSSQPKLIALSTVPEYCNATNAAAKRASAAGKAGDAQNL
jgi:hypothetical protein